MIFRIHEIFRETFTPPNGDYETETGWWRRQDMPETHQNHPGLYQSVHHESTFSSCSGLLQPSTILFPNLVTSIAIII